MSKYGKPIWKIVLEAAEELDSTVFSPQDIINKAHVKYPEIPDVSLRTYVIAMAPEHPSSHHYPSTHKNHRYFKYHGSGKFSLLNKITPDCPQKPPCPDPVDPKKAFIKRYGETMLTWVAMHSEEIIEARRTYTWGGKPMLDCVRGRNNIQSAIVESRIRNSGGVDLKTLDRVMDWGGMRRFAVDEDEALDITRESFRLLDEGNLKKATLKLTSVYGVGIASATKVIGLYDPNRYAIYDSRVGTALRSLVSGDKRLIKCPAGRSRPGDACSNLKWAEEYEKLIWILEIISENLSEKGYPFNVADVEMALFMMGK